MSHDNCALCGTLTNHTTTQHEAALEDTLRCPECGELTKDGEYCGECLSQRAEYYIPDEGA
jgi:hypothetical protein